MSPRVVSAAAHTFMVETTADTTDNVTGDGICVDSAGNCSLRAVVDEANALQQTAPIDVPAGASGLSLGYLAIADPAGIVITGVSGDAGGIYNYRNGEVLAHDTCAGNTANADTGWGGGLYEYDTSTIVDTLISNNHADTAAGGRCNDHALFATGNAIVGTTSNQGAGVYSENKAQFENTTFSGNVASGASKAGGAIYSRSSPISLNYVTLSGSVSDLGAGIYDLSSGGVIGSSILWNNVTSGGTEAGCAVKAGRRRSDRPTATSLVTPAAPTAVSTRSGSTP